MAERMARPLPTFNVDGVDVDKTGIRFSIPSGGWRLLAIIIDGPPEARKLTVEEMERGPGREEAVAKLEELQALPLPLSFDDREAMHEFYSHAGGHPLSNARVKFYCSARTACGRGYVRYENGLDELHTLITYERKRQYGIDRMRSEGIVGRLLASPHPDPWRPDLFVWKHGRLEYLLLRLVNGPARVRCSAFRGQALRQRLIERTPNSIGKSPNKASMMLTSKGRAVLNAWLVSIGESEIPA
ncbi:MAG: hypothetical protein KAG89_02410 [Fulvimarina manganoxydans]|uniref:hypothetical protein n=1 Tax=Fulvimarina manganoxydans TaxID=937218 RepID=UPI0023565479|nr:hypothetical protein [Fulvimarina manganoxydans]MCK5930997.1 hypothetical protein [Fulvimarina manganoxydans]